MAVETSHANHSSGKSCAVPSADLSLVEEQGSHEISNALNVTENHENSDLVDGTDSQKSKNAKKGTENDTTEVESLKLVGRVADDNKKMDGFDENSVSPDCSPSKCLVEAAQNLRRSQRASAKRAKEKLRGEMKLENCDVGRSNPNENLDIDMDNTDIRADPLVPGLKLSQRKLVDSKKIDATDPHFAVQMTEHGAVVVLSDESDVSSLHSEEIYFLRKNYDKLKFKELTEEQMVERERMIQELKTQLRIEEARLSFVKRVRQIQKFAHNDAVSQQQLIKYSHYPPGISARNQNFSASPNLPHPPAYKPPVAVVVPNQHHAYPKGAKVPQGSTTSTGGSRLTTQTASLSNATASLNLASRQPPSQQHSAVASSSAPFAGGAAIGGSTPIAQTPAQREAAAKLAWRRQMEKTLLQIPPPKPPPAQLDFVPNPNQPEFLCLLGLDEVVERLLNVKQAHLLKQRKYAEKIAAANHTATRAESTEKWRLTGKRDGAVAVNEKCNVTADVYDVAAVKSTPLRKRTHADDVVTGRRAPPFRCAQCSTDYTPSWKWGADAPTAETTDDVVVDENVAPLPKEGAAAIATLETHASKNAPACIESLSEGPASKAASVVCEQCVRSNQKKALRVEHTNLLREKFGEALKQEREIERQIKDGTFNFASLNIPAAAGTPPSTNQTPLRSTASSGALTSLSSAVGGNALRPQQSMAGLTVTSSNVSHHYPLGVGAKPSPASHMMTSSAANLLTSPVSTASLMTSPAYLAAAMLGAAAMGGGAGVVWNPLIAAAARFPHNAAAIAAAAAAFSSSTSATAVQSAATPSGPPLRQNWQAAIAAAAASHQQQQRHLSSSQQQRHLSSMASQQQRHISSTSQQQQRHPSMISQQQQRHLPTVAQQQQQRSAMTSSGQQRQLPTASRGLATSAQQQRQLSATKDVLKSMQQQYQQQQQQQAMQRQVYLEMMPRSQKWK